MNALAALWGAIVEAWQELRIHRTRVLLSLIGVGVAVCALSSVVGVANIAEQGMREGNERSGGRPALIAVFPNDSSATSEERLDAAWDTILKRHGIRYSSKVGNVSLPIQFRDGVTAVMAQTVDQPYATMHRTVVEQGRWFQPADEQLLAPPIIVNEAFWRRLGSPPLAEHPTATVLNGESKVTAVVVGVMKTPYSPDDATAIVLNASLDRLASSRGLDFGAPSLEAWVPPEIATPMVTAITSEFDRALGTGAISVNRNDYLAHLDQDPLWYFKLIVGGIAVLILLLGALGLVNIAMVTVRHRIREIGVRRSFGATGARVFFAVMMESVVATVVAGAAGVALSVLVVKNPWVEERLGGGMITDMPPYPVEAAVLGLVAATAVGALAGLLPALVAVRVKVIDAIRY
ncbi:ABC transporter permease [Leifsonia shinshuensis]|uniref:FtsX-like permease family protein n=1 Tax=Leifsonia shinshuensis TaxID=150026 RepID=A0A7G6Y5T2_9MICO|nr:ABC transporter permease [Leifsonia shinshuensis]QNE33847.1 FtsX-like permease family protein [Leifsonia shinshuensis]